MKLLNDEVAARRRFRLRKERDACHAEVAELRGRHALTANELARRRINRNTHQTLKYSPAGGFLGTWLAVALMSILSSRWRCGCLVNTAHRHEPDRAPHRELQPRRLAKGAQESSDQIVLLHSRASRASPASRGANGKNGAPGQPGSVCHPNCRPAPRATPARVARPAPRRSSGPARAAAGTPGAEGGTTGPAGPSGAAERKAGGARREGRYAAILAREGREGRRRATPAYRDPRGSPDWSASRTAGTVGPDQGADGHRDLREQRRAGQAGHRDRLPDGARMPLGGGFQWVPTTEQIAAVASFRAGATAGSSKFTPSA